MHAPSENPKKQIILPHVSTYSLARPLCIYFIGSSICAHSQPTRKHFPCPFSPPISSHSLATTPSAAVRAAKLAHPQRLLLTPWHPRRPQPSAQPSSLIPSVFFSPPISSHPLGAHAIRRRPRSQARSSPAASSPTHFQPLPCTHAVRSRPRSQARSSPAASSPHPCPATRLHPPHPQPSAQPSSLIPSGFLSPPISSHALVHAVRSRPCSHVPFLSLPFPSFPVLSLPFPSFPFLSLPFPSFPFLSLPFPSFPFLSLSFPSFPFLSLPFLSCPFRSLPFPFSLSFHFFPFLSRPFPSFPFLSLPFPSFPVLSLLFPSFPFLSLAPTPSAHHRSKQLAPHAVKQLNENPSIEDAFGNKTGSKPSTSSPIETLGGLLTVGIVCWANDFGSPHTNMFEMKCTRRHDPERGPENWLRRSKPETRNPKGLIGTTLPSEILDDLHPGKLTITSLV